MNEILLSARYRSPYVTVTGTVTRTGRPGHV